MRLIVTYVFLASGILEGVFPMRDSLGGVMRTSACVLAVMSLLWCDPLAAEQLTPKYCEAFAEHVHDTASTIDEYITDTTRNNMVVDLAGATEGKVRDAATGASDAYGQFLQAAKDYSAALGKLEQLLRSCPPS